MVPLRKQHLICSSGGCSCEQISLFETLFSSESFGRVFFCFFPSYTVKTKIRPLTNPSRLPRFLFSKSVVLVQISLNFLKNTRKNKKLPKKKENKKSGNALPQIKNRPKWQNLIFRFSPKKQSRSCFSKF